LVSQVGHLGLTVADLNRSIWFYCSIAGFALVRRVDSLLGGEWFDVLTENDGARVTAAYLSSGGLTLQLVQYHASARRPAVLDHAAAGTPHLSLSVSDVHARHRLATEHDLHTSPVVSHVLAPALSFYVRDPDGVPVEFIQTI
jgi:glyoxylase I family protein